MSVIRIQIQNGTDRERMTWALANNGYSVKVVEENDPKLLIGKNYFIEFETDNRVSIIE